MDNKIELCYKDISNETKQIDPSEISTFVWSVWSFKSLMAFLQLPSNEWWVQIKSKKDWMDHSALLRRHCSTLIKPQPFLCYLNCYDNSLGTKTTWASKDHLIEDYTKRFAFNGLLWTEKTAKNTQEFQLTN